MKVEIAITIYRAAKDGIEEDAWQVSIERGATISSLRNRIGVLYGLPPLMQTLRRDPDSPPLAENELLGCDEGDILYLTLASPEELLMGSMADPLSMGIPGLDGIFEAVSEAVNEVAATNQALQESLESTSYKLTFVMPAQGSAREKRVQLEVAAVARVEEVLDMVKLELDAEALAVGLEFAGEELPQHASIHALGIRDGDLLMVLRRAQQVTSV